MSAIGNTWAFTSFWPWQINSISSLYIIQLTPFPTQVLQFPEQNPSETALRSSWANSPCSHHKHSSLLWEKTWWANVEKLINPEFSSSSGCDLPFLLDIIHKRHMVGRLPSQTRGKMPTREQNGSFRSVLPRAFLFCSEQVWGARAHVIDSFDKMSWKLWPPKGPEDTVCSWVNSPARQATAELEGSVCPGRGVPTTPEAMPAGC